MASLAVLRSLQTVSVQYRVDCQIMAVSLHVARSLLTVLKLDLPRQRCLTSGTDHVLAQLLGTPRTCSKTYYSPSSTNLHDGSTVGSSTSQDLASVSEQLEYWRSLLHNKDGARIAGAGGRLDDQQIYQLLRTAIRLREGRLDSVLPSQVLSTVMQLYRQGLPQLDDKKRLLTLLTGSFGVRVEEVTEAVDAWQRTQATTSESQQDTALAEANTELALKQAQRLQQACEPLYSQLFVPLSNQPDGIKFLVDLRADALAAAKQGGPSAPAFRAFSNHLRSRLAEWFSVGMLQLSRVAWETSSAHVLERVSRGEAVHPVRGWEDLKRRLAPHRRCYAFFHPAMPQEPLVVLHVALRQEHARTIAEVLDYPDADPDELKAEAHSAETAVFYSISSTQKGLSGVDLGHFLIAQAARMLLADFPNLKELVTLSPLPGLRKWIDVQLARGLTRSGGTGGEEVDVGTPQLLLPDEAKNIRMVAASVGGPVGDPHGLAALQWSLQEGRWLRHAQLREVLRPTLMRLAARYLLLERRRRAALDSVANFHLRNGASVWRLIWQADTSPESPSVGIMVSYRYDLAKVPENNRDYLVKGLIHTSRWVEVQLGEDARERSDKIATEHVAEL